MKKLYFNYLAVLLTLLSITFNTNAQTGHFTIIQQPCDEDGIVAFTVDSGLTPPLTFEYYNGGPFVFATHSNVNTMSDTLYNLYTLHYNGFAVHITDNFGNFLSLSGYLPPPFLFDGAFITNAQCPDTIGSVEITINGGQHPANVKYYDYNFFIPFPFSTPVVAQGNPINIPAGEYFVEIIDSNGCTDKYFEPGLWVGLETNIMFDIETTEASCSNGTAVITDITGAIAPYTYQWSNGQTSDSISNLMAGHYYVTLTDSIGCSRMRLFTINENSNISANFTSSNPTCTLNDGSITAYGSDGISPYTYSWGNGASWI